MTYQEFKDKYNGKYVDVDGYPSNWKYQCFDLVQKYIPVPNNNISSTHTIKRYFIKILF